VSTCKQVQLCEHLQWWPVVVPLLWEGLFLNARFEVVLPALYTWIGVSNMHSSHRREECIVSAALSNDMLEINDFQNVEAHIWWQARFTRPNDHQTRLCSMCTRGCQILSLISFYFLLNVLWLNKQCKVLRLYGTSSITQFIFSHKWIGDLYFTCGQIIWFDSSIVVLLH